MRARKAYSKRNTAIKIEITKFVIERKYAIENAGKHTVVAELATDQGVIGEHAFTTEDLDTLGYKAALPYAINGISNVLE